MDFHDSKMTADLEKTQRVERQMERLMGVEGSDDEYSDAEEDGQQSGMVTPCLFIPGFCKTGKSDDLF